jgi:hypothetical protein
VVSGGFWRVLVGSGVCWCVFWCVLMVCGEFCCSGVFWRVRSGGLW